MTENMADDPRIVFGSTVRRYRRKLGITQEELAYRAGLNATFIGIVERGDTNITLLNAVRIAAGLGVKFRYLTRNL